MIQVVTMRSAAGTYEGFTVTGHADYAAAGEDIVCAAVSAVTMTASVGLRDIIGCPGIYETEEGRLTVRLANEPTAETQAIIRTMLAGLREIETQYPQYLNITDRRR